MNLLGWGVGAWADGTWSPGAWQELAQSGNSSGGGYRLTRSELMRRLRARAEEVQAEADAVIAKAKGTAPEPAGTLVEDALIELAAEEIAAAPDPELRVRELTAADMRAFRDMAVLADDEEVLLLLS